MSVILGGFRGSRAAMLCCARRSIGCRSKIRCQLCANVIAAKIQTGDRVSRRQIRNDSENTAIQSTVDSLNILLRQLSCAERRRGIEGDASANYFGIFGLLLIRKTAFLLTGATVVCPEAG